MAYGVLLERAWNIVWEHKFMILLGMLVALGGASGGVGGSSNVNFEGGYDQGDFRLPEEFEDFEFYRPPENLFEDFQVPNLAIGAVIALVIVGVLIGLLLWAVSTTARGGLIASANTIAEGGVSSFGQAFSAGWRRLWRLLGISILPALPGLLLALLSLGFFAIRYEVFGSSDMPSMPLGVGASAVLGVLACLLVPLSLILGVLRAFADRACVLEELGVFGAYRRGLEVFSANLGPAVLLFLIQLGMGIGVGLLSIILLAPMTFCCCLAPLLVLLVPILWGVSGLASAYFSTQWTLAWRQWTGQA